MLPLLKNSGEVIGIAAERQCGPGPTAGEDDAVVPAGATVLPRCENHEVNPIGGRRPPGDVLQGVSTPPLPPPRLPNPVGLNTAALNRPLCDAAVLRKNVPDCESGKVQFCPPFVDVGVAVLLLLLLLPRFVLIVGVCAVAGPSGGNRARPPASSMMQRSRSKKHTKSDAVSSSTAKVKP